MVRDLYTIISKLKKTKRQGWLGMGLDSDSIASHIYGATSIGLLLAKEENADQNKVVLMLVVHDWVMARMKDVTPLTDEYKQKREMEQQALIQVLAEIPETIRTQYSDLFSEFNARNTNEAQVALEADKLETLLQGDVFEEDTGRNDILDTFFEGYKSYFKTKTGIRYFEELKQNHLNRNK